MLLTGVRLMYLMEALFSDLAEMSAKQQQQQQQRGPGWPGGDASRSGMLEEAVMMEDPSLTAGSGRLDEEQLRSTGRRGVGEEEQPLTAPAASSRVEEALLTDVVCAVASMVEYLACIDLQLSMYRQTTGSLVEDSDGSNDPRPEEEDGYYMEAAVGLGARGAGGPKGCARDGSFSSGPSSCDWGAAPDMSFALSAPVTLGRPSVQLPADDGLRMPLSECIRGSAAEAGCSGSGNHDDVTFQFGTLTATVSWSSYRAVRRLSPLIHGWLSRRKGRPAGGAITVLRVPGLTDEQNHAVFCHLLAWAGSGRLQAGLPLEDVMVLWRSSDYLQVEGGGEGGAVEVLVAGSWVCVWGAM